MQSQGVTKGYTHSHRVASGPSPNAFWESQSVIKSHQAQILAHSESHKASQSRTRPQPQHFLGVTHHHKVAQSPSPSTFCASQSVTKSHQDPTPALAGSHRASQCRTRPQPQRIFGLTQHRKVALGPSPSTFCAPQIIMQSHQAENCNYYAAQITKRYSTHGLRYTRH